MPEHLLHVRGFLAGALRIVQTDLQERRTSRLAQKGSRFGQIDINPRLVDVAHSGLVNRSHDVTA